MAETKPKKVSELDALSKVKCTKEAVTTKEGKETPFSFHVDASKTSLFATKQRRKISFFAFRKEPVLYVKQFPALAVHTNATAAQLELIAKTPLNKLKEIYNGI